METEKTRQTGMLVKYLVGQILSGGIQRVLVCR